MQQANFIVLIALAAVAFAIALTMSYRVMQLEKSVYQLRAQMRKLNRQAGVEDEPPIDKEIYALARSGKTIAAIKLYREKTGEGLKESKDVIDAIMRGEDTRGL